ncbi:PREDICTED: uncharacterized protein LOC108360954, partial [Rhagoletis zephyria]|uniref:uncharacterized protein LOC108360954 n=1 Tax=Rhagoletis zephyria TaxID=28612 RepID=UPI000811256D
MNADEFKKSMTEMNGAVNAILSQLRRLEERLKSVESKTNDESLQGLILKKIDEVVDRTNYVAKETESIELEQSALHNILLVRDEINEIVRACQLAKHGIVNTNLLDTGEVNQILSEIETLPYQNVIEAIEYGEPSVLTNGTLLIYVLSMPKVTASKYNLLITRAGIYEGKQLDLQFDRMLVNQKETYGLTKDCLMISSTTVCKAESLIKLEESDCLPRLLKGGEASCQFKRRNDTHIELINENTIFISNYQGKIRSNNGSEKPFQSLQYYSLPACCGDATPKD